MELSKLLHSLMGEYKFSIIIPENMFDSNLVNKHSLYKFITFSGEFEDSSDAKEEEMIYKKNIKFYGKNEEFKED